VRPTRPASRPLSCLPAALAVAAAPGLAEAQGTLRGVVFDSLAGAPLAAATVQIAPAADAARARTVTADSLGRFAFDTVAPGRWLIGFVHPAVHALGLEMPVRALDVGAAPTTAIELALPGGPTLRRVLCGEPRDSTGAIAGVARDAATGEPLADATLTVSWREFQISGGRIRSDIRRVPVRATAGGVFVVCGAPSDAELSLRGEGSGGRASGEVYVRAPARGLLRQDVSLGDSLARASRLAGVVVDARAGRPLGEAGVAVLGTSARGVTTGAGAFQLDGLPAGSWTLEARAIGYEPVRVPVVLAAGTEARARVPMPRYAPSLDRVVVMGQGSRRFRGMEGFLRRRERGYAGTFLSQAELEARRTLFASALIADARGLQVVPLANGYGGALRGRGGCRVDVFVDGVLITNGADEFDRVVGPNEMLAAEVYPSGIDTPPEFVPPRGGGCGAVVVWTKR
jgi:hypothetical protein